MHLFEVGLRFKLSLMEMKSSAIILGLLILMTNAFGGEDLSTKSYLKCLNSLKEETNFSMPEIDAQTKLVFHKKSLYDREVFIVDSKKFYSCGDLSIQSPTSTDDVLNFEAVLVINQKKVPLLFEIPAPLTFGAEDIMVRESRAKKLEILNCSSIPLNEFDLAFVETVGARLKGFVIEFNESVMSKKNQERAKIWGSGWRAKDSIDNQRNIFLKTLNKCSGIKALLQIKTQTELDLKKIK